MTRVEAEFRKLEESDRREGRLEQRVEAGSPVGLVLGVAHPSRTRLLIVEAPSDAIDQLGDLDETRGIRTRVESRTGPHGWDAGLVLEVADRSFNEIFAILAEDVIGVASKSTSSSAGGDLAARLAHWRRFLERVTPEGLSQEAQRGLYGELQFLRDHAFEAVGVEVAVASWRGPSHEVQDFVVAAWGLEVKTTAVRSHQALSISSEHQLDVRGLDTLFLYHLSVDARSGLGETLPAIVADIRDALISSPSASSAFEDLLMQSGYHDAHAGLYDLGYALRDEIAYSVRADFPRIVEEDLRPGVAGVRYSIAADACAPFQVTVVAVRESLSKTVGP
jgi:hypothetical protein